MENEIKTFFKEYKENKNREKKEQQEEEDLVNDITSIILNSYKDSEDTKWQKIYDKIKNIECDLPLDSSYIDWDSSSVCPILYGSNKSKSLLMLWLNTTIGEYADNYLYGASLETIINKLITEDYLNELQAYLQEQFLSNFYALYSLNSLVVSTDETNPTLININFNITNLLDSEKTIFSVEYNTNT